PREFSTALAELTGAPLEREDRPSRRRTTPRQEPEAIYSYHDSQGSLLYEVLRLPGKNFLMRRPDPGSPGGWSWNVPRRVKVPYRLAELHAAPLEQWVFVPEGEKDVDRLRLHGLMATTNPSGARKWLEQYNPWFAGRRVALLPDNDDVGRRHADLRHRGRRAPAGGVPEPHYLWLGGAGREAAASLPRPNPAEPAGTRVLHPHGQRRDRGAVLLRRAHPGGHPPGLPGDEGAAEHPLPR
ncbi:MAG: hypothetical protein HYX97_02920, partial [Chloroflexi bacterium]|nr:hypothetical protein [Chloroflexota bacterium]